jgi:hypothetical protein
MGYTFSPEGGKRDAMEGTICHGRTEAETGVSLVSFMSYDLGYIDLEEKTLQPLDKPFGPKMLPMS